MQKKLLIILLLLIMMSALVCNAAQPPKLPPPIPGTNIQFYAAINGKQTGPFDMATLRGMVQTYQINGFTLVWCEGMDTWTQASLVPELQKIFGRQTVIQSSNIGTQSYVPAQTFADNADMDLSNIQSVDPNKPLTDKEQKYIAEKLVGKWNVNPTDKAAMKKTFFNNLAAGIALGTVGTVLQCVGAGIMGGLMSSAPQVRQRKDYSTDEYYTDYYLDPVFMIVGGVVGGNLLTAGTIIGPLCAVPFVYAGRTGNIYKKTTGTKLFSFNFNGGYDWERKEVMLAMAVRL